MKQFAITVLFTTVSLVLWGQAKPDWLNEDWRNRQFPKTVFLTGFTEYVIENGKSVQNATDEAKLKAQENLTQEIRLQISSTTRSTMSVQSLNGQYNENESFDNQATAKSNAEIVGLKIETYFDSNAKIVYAFASANKYELIGYYKSNLSVNINQIESFVRTAQDLELNKEKAKARRQLELAQPLFSKIRSAQDLLIALDGNATAADLQQVQTEMLYNQLTRQLANLAQATYVYVKSSEDLFGQKVDIVANKLKAELAATGCSFVEDGNQADLLLTINVTTRLTTGNLDFVFCYADATIDLFDNHKQKTIYSDNISEKGASNTQDKAGRKAMENIVSQIKSKINDRIN